MNCLIVKNPLEFPKGKRFPTFDSRIHKMEPMGSENLERFIEAYQNIGAYYLVPSFAPEGFDGSQPPKFGWEYFIGLRGLYIREAYEIGPNDIDATVIREGDDPIIPEEHKDDAPILNLLENRKEE